MNLGERLFAEMTRQQIRRGVFKSVAELQAAIETWFTERNAKPKPFKWTAKAHTILEKNARARRALEEAVSGVSNEKVRTLAGFSRAMSRPSRRSSQP